MLITLGMQTYLQGGLAEQNRCEKLICCHSTEHIDLIIHLSCIHLRTSCSCGHAYLLHMCAREARKYDLDAAEAALDRTKSVMSGIHPF